MKNRTRAQAAAHLRQMADELERGELTAVVAQALPLQSRDDAPVGHRNLLDRAYGDPWMSMVLDEHINDGNVQTIYDPCLGEGDLLWPLLNSDRRNVVGSDVNASSQWVDAPTGAIPCRRIDLLAEPERAAGLARRNYVDWIVTNAPHFTPHPKGRVTHNGQLYATATQFIEQCLEIRPRVAALCRLSFLEPVVERAALLKRISRIIILPHIKCRTPDGVEDDGSTDSQASCCWVIWEPDAADARVRWVSPEQKRRAQERLEKLLEHNKQTGEEVQ